VERPVPGRDFSRCRPAPFHGARKYLNNVIEQDHRIVKKRVWLAKGDGSFQSAWRTLQGIETVHMIRKGRVRWLAKDDALGQALFITDLFAIPA
jgi:IS6 family transposase